MTSKKESSLLQYRNLVSSIRIDHAAYAGILDRLVNAYDDVGQTPVPTCLHLAGETRTGKSCVIRDFIDTVSAREQPDASSKSIVLATAIAKASAISLLRQLLRGLGDPLWSKGSGANLEARLDTMLRGVSCKLIIIDEFQHLSDKGQNKSLVQTTSVLKNLLECNEWGLVAVGMPNSSRVIDADAQLAGRFDPTLPMPLFDWRDAKMQLEFQGILHAFVQQLMPFELPDFSLPDNAFRMYLATSGRLGLLAKLVDRAVKRAIERQSTRIEMKHLEAAFRESIWYAPRFPIVDGPFLADLDPCQAATQVQTVLHLSTHDTYEDNSATVQVIRPRAARVEEPAKSKRRHREEMAAAL
jgi:hypothetical protein